MRSLSFMFLASATCVTLAACGSSATNSGGGTTSVTPGGGSAGNSNTVASPSSIELDVTLNSFAFDPNAATLDPTNLQVAVKDLAVVFAGGTAAANNTVSITQGQCTSAAGKLSCPIKLTNIDPNGLTDGLVVLTSDSRVSSNPPRWQATYTVVPQATIDAAKAASNHAASVNAAVLSSDGLTQIATAGGTTAATLTTNGGFLGVVTEKDGSTPVAGVTLNTGSESDTVAYASDTGTATGGKSTGALGLVLAYPSAAAVQLDKDWTLMPPTGNASTWTLPTVGIAPFAVTVAFFPAN